MKQYTVTGMSCAACSSKVEKEVSKLSGVTSCSVSLLTNSMIVEGSESDETIISTVEKAGYHATVKGPNHSSDTHNITNSSITSNDELDFVKKDITNLKVRLVSSLLFLLILMYFSMGHSMFNMPIPDYFVSNVLACGLLQMLLAIIVMIINQKFFINGFKSFANKSPNMDTLVALGSGASFVYSVYALFAMSDAIIDDNLSLAHSYYHDLYFESAAMILALITVGKMLEAHSKGKTTNALQSLMKLKPKTATIIIDDNEVTISADDIKKDDIFIVKPGSVLPVDGIIIEGHCAINESALTGESIPVDKTINDTVYAGTINQSGFIKCRATKTSEDTTLAQIIQMVSDVAATKAPIAKIADKVSGIFVPTVITIAFITAIIWLVCGETFGFALTRAISVLVISCPCALGLATPVAIMVGNGVGAKQGILFKTASALETAGKAKIIALDKTGTITSGIPQVIDIIPYSNVTKDDLLSIAYSLEIKSEHPLAHAIVKKAELSNSILLESADFEIFPGNGLTAIINNKEVFGGNLKFISNKTVIPDDALRMSKELASEGKTPLFFVNDEEFIGIIAVADTIKEDSPAAIKDLKQMGLYVVMLTGDNKQTANAIKEIINVDEVIAEVLPSEKEKVISNLKEKGITAMVGDGINDAPALTSADIGIAIGAGTDVAIDAASIVLMKNRLSDVSAAIRLSRFTLRNIKQNLFWAFIYNIIGIPLAAGVWIPVFGLKLNPMFGAAAMSLSSFCVVSNALRLNLMNIHISKKDKAIKNPYNGEPIYAKDDIQISSNKNIINNENTINYDNSINKNQINKVKKETNIMEKTVKIEGMMCGHCEARVKKCLEGIAGVNEAIVSHETGTATIISNKEIADDVIKSTIEEQGYTVL